MRPVELLPCSATVSKTALTNLGRGGEWRGGEGRGGEGGEREEGGGGEREEGGGEVAIEVIRTVDSNGVILELP